MRKTWRAHFSQGTSSVPGRVTLVASSSRRGLLINQSPLLLTTLYSVRNLACIITQCMPDKCISSQVPIKGAPCRQKPPGAEITNSTIAPELLVLYSVLSRVQGRETKVQRRSSPPPPPRPSPTSPTVPVGQADDYIPWRREDASHSRTQPRHPPLLPAPMRQRACPVSPSVPSPATRSCCLCASVPFRSPGRRAGVPASSHCSSVAITVEGEGGGTLSPGGKKGH